MSLILFSWHPVELPRDDGDADHLSVALHAHLRPGHGHGPAHGHASNGTSTKKAHELDPEEVDLSDAIVDANGDAHIPFTLENYKSEVWRVIKYVFYRYEPSDSNTRSHQY